MEKFKVRTFNPKHPNRSGIVTSYIYGFVFTEEHEFIFYRNFL